MDVNIFHFLFTKTNPGENFSCPKCRILIYDFDKVSEVYQCKNGSWACKNCWVEIFRTTKECPTKECRVESIESLSRSRFIENGFASKNMDCPNSLVQSSPNHYEGINVLLDDDGCKDVVTVGNLSSHLKGCIYAFTKCPNDVNGCTDEFRLKTQDQHLETCGFQLEDCPNCNSKIIRKSMVHHIDEECLKTEIECLKCDEIVERGDMDFHLYNVCPNIVIPCILCDNGCDLRFKRSELSNHLQSIEHISHLNNKIDELNETLNDLQISELNQKVEQLETLLTQARDDPLPQREINRLISKQEKFKSVWEIKNFSKRQFQKGFYFSSPVITVGHHSFHLWLYPNGETSPSNSLSLYLVLTKGEKTLVNFSISIKNHNGSNLNSTGEFENYKCLEVGGTRWGWAFEKDFKNGGYLKNDTLSIQFTIAIKKQPLTTDILSVQQ
ncbi:hypothetical protein ACTFIR_009014 [Dictyostelium discoideum]